MELEVEGWRITSIYNHYLKEQFKSKYLISVPLSQFEKVNNKKESLGTYSMSWI